MEPKPTITIGPSIWAYTGHFVIIREPPGIWAGDICRAVETEEDAAPWHGVLVRVVLSQAACAAASPRSRPAKSGIGARMPVGPIKPRAPSRAPGASSPASSRFFSYGPGSHSAPVFSAEKPKRP